MRDSKEVFDEYIQSLERRKQQGERIQEDWLKKTEKQLETLRKALETFAADHKDEIRKDPEFRIQFNRMCAELKVDPLQTRKNFWAKLLGVGDFYHELSVKVIETCWSLKAKYNQMIPMEVVLEGVKKTYRDDRGIIAADIETALKNLAALGGSYSVISFKKRKFIKTTSFAIDEDAMRILEAAEERAGREEHACYVINGAEIGIDPERFMAAIEGLMREGLIWVDSQAPDGPRYYVPALFSQFK